MRSARWPSAHNFCARIVPDFRKFCKIFARFFAQNFRHLDAGLARYLALECTPTLKRAAAKLCGLRNHAGGVHATFVRAARRFFFFRNLNNSFAQVGLRICVISMLDAFFFKSEFNADSKRFAQPCWPSSRNFCARGAPIFFGNFAILSRELGAKCA